VLHLERTLRRGRDRQPRQATRQDGLKLRAYRRVLTNDALRPGASGTPPPVSPPDAAVLITTYHPLLVESHHSVLPYLFMLGDFAALLCAFVRAVTVVENVGNRKLTIETLPVRFPLIP
jgi:hypothetical protein